jgi:hypothetical protein
VTDQRWWWGAMKWAVTSFKEAIGHDVAPSGEEEATAGSWVGAVMPRLG